MTERDGGLYKEPELDKEETELAVDEDSPDGAGGGMDAHVGHCDAAASNGSLAAAT